LTSVLAMATGLAIVFAFGVTWLALFARPAALGFAAALEGGFYAFLPVDIYKILVAATILPAVWKFTRT
ncbi:MAG: biotin transporter BioY, partial [Vicinamibacterales bacterium]